MVVVKNPKVNEANFQLPPLQSVGSTKFTGAIRAHTSQISKAALKYQVLKSGRFGTAASDERRLMTVGGNDTGNQSPRQRSWIAQRKASAAKIMIRDGVGGGASDAERADMRRLSLYMTSTNLNSSRPRNTHGSYLASIGGVSFQSPSFINIYHNPVVNFEPKKRSMSRAVRARKMRKGQVAGAANMEQKVAQAIT